MKKIIAIVIMIMVVVSFSSTSFAKSWTDNWTLNGIPLNKFKEAKGMDYVELAGGMATSAVTHWLGHIIWLESNGKKWHQDGLTEMCESYLNRSEMHDFGIAGMITQLLGGTIIKFTDLNDTFFATGYHTWSFMEVSTYRMIHGKNEGDLNMMELGNGHANEEHIMLTIWAGSLLIDWK